MSETTGKGVISQNDLMQKLVQAKKVMNKVDSGNFERGNVNEAVVTNSPDELDMSTMSKSMNVPKTMNVDKIMESKLPDAIKKAMMENPIPQISLSDSLDMDFVQNTKKLMEAEGVQTKPRTSQPQSGNMVTGDQISQLTPLIENVVKKTVMEVMDAKLNQILTAQQTMTISENLVLKVGDSIFKGKITGVNKYK